MKSLSFVGFGASEPAVMGDNKGIKLRAGIPGRNDDDITWLTVLAWEKDQPGICKALGYMKKGKPFAGVGDIALNSWEKDGNTRTDLQVTLNQFFFLPGGPRDDNADTTKTKSNQAPTTSEEDIPF